MSAESPIPAEALNQHVIVLGKTRSGKSSKMRLLVEGLLDDHKPVCIIDPKGDWWGLKSSADGKKAGYPVIIFGGEHADVPINEHSGAHIAELIATGNRPCIIDLGGWMVGARTRFFVDFAATLFKLTRGPRWLVIDECHNFAPQGRVLDPDAGKMLHWANRLASEGSGKGLTLISASQRPQKVHKDYVTSHETLIATRVIHPLDRGAIKDWIDGCADPQIGRDVIAAIAGLDRSQAYVWSPEIGFGPELVTFPMFRTYDSFKAQDHDAPTALKGWATVDLDDVKARLARVVEDAEANDPKRLKAEIARLKAEVSKAPAVDPQAMDAAVKGAHRTGYEAGLAAGDERSYRRGLDDGERLEWKRAFEAAAARNQAAIEQLNRDLTEFASLRDERPVSIFPTSSEVTKIDTPASIAESKTHLPKPAPAPKTLPATSAIAEPALTGPQRTVLRSLAWWAAMGQHAPNRNQVAVICGWSTNSSNIRDRLSDLSRLGMIERPSPGQIRLSDAGRAAAPAPDTSQTLQESVRVILTGPQRQVFDVLLANGVPMPRDAIAEAVGWSTNSSNIRDRLSDLARLEIIERPAPGVVQLQAWVRSA